MPQVAAHPRFVSARSVSIFISLPLELQTRELFERAFAASKRVFVPCVLNEHDMVMLECLSLAEMDTFPRSSFGVPEPPPDSGVPQFDLDLIVMPGLAFDSRSHRLGQGRGYYDRFVAKCRQHSQPFLLGVGLAPQMVPSVPCADSDVQLDEVMIAKSSISIGNAS